MTFHVLVRYVDDLDRLGSAADAPTEYAAGAEAWRLLIARFGPDTALRRFRQEVVLLAPDETIRYVVARMLDDGPADRVSYSYCRTAWAYIDAMVRLGVAAEDAYSIQAGIQRAPVVTR